MALCSSCRRTLLSRLYSLHKPTTRFASTVSATPNAARVQPPPSVIIGSTPATSSSTPGISQPISTPQFPSTSSAKTASASGTKESTKSKVKSSVPGGQELKGLAYLKNKPHVLAKEDDEYPAWLWTLLDDGKNITGDKVDLSTLTKKQRAKYDKKQEKLLKNLPKKIPVHEQSMDLTKPGDDAITSLERRQEVVKSSRAARRKGIRESNFLRSM